MAHSERKLQKPSTAFAISTPNARQTCGSLSCQVDGHCTSLLGLAPEGCLIMKATLGTARWKPSKGLSNGWGITARRNLRGGKSSDCASKSRGLKLKMARSRLGKDSQFNKHQPMKPLSLELKNIGLHADTKIEINQPMLVFFGEVQSGKSTILRAFPLLIGQQEMPKDLIRHGADEAMIRFKYSQPDGSITRTFYRGKNGVTSRPIEWIENGVRVSNPVQKLTLFYNPFQNDGDYLRRQSATGRKEFFRQMFPMDTAALDKEALQCSTTASDLRSKLKGYGEIDLMPVQVVDLSALRSRLEQVRQKAARDVSDWRLKCSEVAGRNAAALAKSVEENNAARSANRDRGLHVMQLEATEKEIRRLTAVRDEHKEWLASHPVVELKPEPGLESEPPPPASADTRELEADIQNGAAQNVKAEQYKANQKRAEQREADKRALAAAEARQDAIKAEKTKLLKSASSKLGIAGFQVDETGRFTFEDTADDMLSESQWMRLQQALSGLYPKGLGLQLVDRGESLGRSGIAALVDHAKKDERNVLVTVVGDAPAETPPDIGVFVVDKGQVTPAKG